GLPELPLLLLGRRILDLAQLLQQLALLRRELVRGPDVDPHVQIAVPALAQPRQPFGADPVRHARLRAGLDPQHRLAERRRHLHLGAERGLRERDPEVVDQIVAVTLEARVVLDVEHRDQVAARPVARARDALAAQRQIVMIGDAGRDVDLNRLLALHAPVAPAHVARAVHHGAFTDARRTGRHGEELPEQRLRLTPHLAAAATGAARHGLRPAARPGPRALGAAVETLDADRLRRAARDFGERQFQTDFDVMTAPAIAPPAAAEQALERAAAAAAADPEVAHEHHERFGKIEVHRAEAGAAAAAHPLVSIAVVGGALLRIAQHLVRFGDELELFFGCLVAVVAVGVALHRQLAVGLLDIRFAAVALDAEDDVEILLHAIRAAPPRAGRCD